jgi:hypothetical protein
MIETEAIYGTKAVVGQGVRAHGRTFSSLARCAATPTSHIPLLSLLEPAGRAGRPLSPTLTPSSSLCAQAWPADRLRSPHTRAAIGASSISLQPVLLSTCSCFHPPFRPFSSSPRSPLPHTVLSLCAQAWPADRLRSPHTRAAIGASSISLQPHLLSTCSCFHTPFRPLSSCPLPLPSTTSHTSASFCSSGLACRSPPLAPHPGRPRRLLHLLAAPPPRDGAAGARLVPVRGPVRGRGHGRVFTTFVFTAFIFTPFIFTP